MQNIQVKALFKIHSGKLNEFKEIASQAIASVKKNEPDVLKYDWFLNVDNTECVVTEIYADSQAVFAHVTNVGELLGKLQLISDLSLEVYGNPSEELKNVITSMSGKLYTFYQGL